MGTKKWSFEFSLNSSKQTAIVRASDDFFPRDPMSHTIHIAAVAYNSVFLGEIMQPDWDMFHSQHPAGEYHASARAISGGPIYVRYTHSHTYICISIYCHKLL